MERFPVLEGAFADPSETPRPAWDLSHRELSAALAAITCSAFVDFSVAAVPSAQRYLFLLFWSRINVYTSMLIVLYGEISQVSPS